MKDDLLEYLVRDFTVSVRDPLWNDILFTPALAQLAQHPQMQKLGRIRQLGPVYLLYPGAVHTRLSHSLGVFSIARRMLLSLLKKSNADLTLEGINSFLAAALLHDLGHFPYAHSLKEVVTISHEQLGAQTIEQTPDLAQAVQKCGAKISKVCEIIDSGRKTEDSETLLYRNLLSGALDPDKLDYLCRDAFFCGIPYGAQDVSYIVEHLLISDGKPALSVTNSSCVEHLLFSKYLMYRNVYWHRTTRAATAMVRSAVTMALRDRVITERDLCFLDDEGLTTLCASVPYPPFELVERVRSGKLFYTNFEIPCPDNLGKKELEDIKLRAIATANGRCKPYEIIVDVPEPISFETNIRLVSSTGEYSSFSDTDELFKKDVSNAFVRALRKIRVFSPLDERFNL